MNRFEKFAAALRATNPGIDVNKETLEAMQTVFDVHCTPVKRPYGRNGSFRIPPEYDPASEFLIEVNLINPRRAELMTRGKRWVDEEEFLYVVLKRKGRWLLDNEKKRLIGANWRKYFSEIVGFSFSENARFSFGNSSVYATIRV